MIGALRMEKVADLHLAGTGPLSAASGIVSVDDRVYVVPDDGLALGCFDEAFARPGKPVPMLPDPPLPADHVERKRQKPDMESLALAPATVTGLEGTRLLSLGSGSAENRCRGVLVPVEGSGEPLVFDLSPLYATLSELLPGLNVEGVAVTPDTVRLVHRGNHASGHNAVIDLDPATFFSQVRERHAVGPEALRGVRPVDLGEVASVPLTFTDVAPAPGGGYLFTASAERTSDPYEDGPVVASVLGWMDTDGSVHGVRLLDPVMKVEGVDASLRADGSMDVRLVTDPDDPYRAGEVYRVSGYRPVVGT